MKIYTYSIQIAFRIQWQASATNWLKTHVTSIKLYENLGTSLDCHYRLLVEINC